MRNKLDNDNAKSHYFHFSTFVFTLIPIILLVMFQFIILSKLVHIDKISFTTCLTMFIYWVVVAIIFTLVIRYQASTRYEKPMIRLAKATKEVANGDFSIYVAPEHPANKFDYLDVMILDFNKMVEELGSLETLKTDFLSNVSHEIKTPLSIIQNYVTILKNKNLSTDECDEYLSVISDATKRLSELISNILKLNRIEKQNIQLNSEQFDICGQLSECILNLEEIWSKKNIEMIVEMEDKNTISSDSALLEIVWNNILSNAIKFTEQGGIITIKESSTIDESIIEISDTGCGMSEETIKHIFDKFYQGDTSHSTVGNGLGLALTIRILDLLSGEIKVKSKLNEGTSFIVTLPKNKKS